MDNSEQKTIVIIGGGIIGVTTAYYLSTHPQFDPTKHSITLLEAKKIGGAASGKAGGLLALWAYPSCIVPLSFNLHTELAEKHDGGKNWGYRRVYCSNYEAVAQSTTAKVDKQSSQKALSSIGAPPELNWVIGNGARSYSEIGSPQDSAQVHPYLFTTSIAKLAEEQGCKIIIGSASEIHYDDAGEAVQGVSYSTSDDAEPQRLPATDLVLAAGPWTPKLLPSAPIGGSRSHSIVVRPSEPVSAYVLFTEIKPASETLVKRPASPEIYARPDNTVYACGPTDYNVPLPASSDLVGVEEDACQSIKDIVGSISAELRDGEIVAKQACYRPVVSARRPFGSEGPLVGETGVKGLILASGHDCWGIQNGPGTGKLVSEMIYDGEAKSADITSLDPRPLLKRKLHSRSN